MFRTAPLSMQCNSEVVVVMAVVMTVTIVMARILTSNSGTRIMQLFTSTASKGATQQAATAAVSALLFLFCPPSFVLGFQMSVGASLFLSEAFFVESPPVL